MTDTTLWLKRHGKSLTFTALFCFVIALGTQAIWPSPLRGHLIISFGYGVSAYLCALVLGAVFPSLSTRHVNLLALAGAMVLGTTNAYIWLNQYPGFDTLAALKPVMMLGLMFTALCFFYFYAHEQKLVAENALEVAKRRQSEQEKALLLSQLKQLQSQIEPHFLFNTLANVNVLIASEPHKAQRMLEKLTDLLRSSMRHREGVSTLKDELELIDAYLGIQSIRLGNRLRYSLPNDPQWHALCLPPMLLQPLVENAIEHGIEPKAEGGEVNVTIERQQDAIVLTVSDNGAGLGEIPKGNGIALENVRQRLQGLFGRDAKFTLTQNAKGGVTATIRIAEHAMTHLQGEHDVA
ncbi:sensor histidine kinase [Vibrio furnissii]|uniref:sensor histidine kinase n=1 Tax=Vibrio furnissii TaxID=29494 RepID=UPI001EE9D7F1|nr:sensor histidine kinase [Vibrio furnissii]MCG6233936.1 sensor histidine kinase [Vibrio furnissii]MCG6260026.1 sensor histidine kinase [Vibrio furnissii]